MIFPQADLNDDGRKKPQRFISVNDAHQGTQHQITKRRARQIVPQLFHEFARSSFNGLILGGMGAVV
jgi:hypothetical protein